MPRKAIIHRILKITFVLNEPRNPKNIGASARGMANFGFRNLAVVNPYAVAWRETRAAVNAGAVVEKAKKYASLKSAVRSAHVVIGTSAGSRRNLKARWIGFDELRPLVDASEKAGESVALVFGSERSGLSNADLSFCHYVLRIPTVRECPSMNLAQAVAVTACAIRRAPAAASAPSASSARVSTVHIERLVARGLEAFTAAGLLRAWDAARRERRVRQAFYRWNLSDVDVAMLHSLFTWVLKR